MARREGAVLKITTRGLRKYEKITQLNEGDLVRSLNEDFIPELGVAAVFVLQAKAPERTGHLKETIHVTGRNRSISRPNIRVGVDAPYLNITRFGRKAVVAKGRATMARTFNHPGGPTMQKRPFRARMLKFEPGPPGSGFMYRRRVRAFHPKRDWIRAASDLIKIQTDALMEEFTDEVEKVLMREGRTIHSGVRRSSVKVASRTGRFS